MPYSNQRDNALQILANFQVFVVMLAGLILKFRTRGTDNIDEYVIGVFLILLNILGATTFVLFLLFKFVFPRTANEMSNRPITWLDVFSGRKKSARRSPSGIEVLEFEDGVRIELGTIHSGASSDEFKSRENPIRSAKLEDIIGVPLPPAEVQGSEIQVARKDEGR